MPEIQTIEIEAQRIKQGDIVNVNGASYDVARVDVKSLYTYTMSGDDRKRRFANDQVVTVLRSMATAEEKAQAEHEYTMTLVHDLLNALRKDSQRDITAEFADKMSSYQDFAQGFGWYAEDALKASHRKGFALELIAYLERMDVEDDAAVDRYLAQGLHFLAEECEKVMRRAARNPARSSSVMSNIAEQMKGVAAAEIVEDYRMVHALALTKDWEVQS